MDQIDEKEKGKNKECTNGIFLSQLIAQFFKFQIFNNILINKIGL